MSISDFIADLYYLLLILTTIVFSVSTVYGARKFLPITICLIIGCLCEFFTFLIREHHLLIMGEQNNAIVGHVYKWTSFLTFGFFLYSVQKSKAVKRLFVYLFSICAFIGVCSQLMIKQYFLQNDPWLAFSLMSGVIIASMIYYIKLLKDTEGYPYITTGIFLVSGSFLISSAVNGTYVDVDLEVWFFRESINRIVLIIMYVMFLLGAYLFFKKEDSFKLQRIQQ
ncbi:hypothetical protein FNJ87_17675 [Nonlabens mediterrranea]|uniref:Uncharacterized protein n=1 Tax=Nonlabens mediterrranea TaxID=1419947 RepID=A0ABS0A9J9_9FLAO|nr:hypothetical protein [Nonlabens mediterrranea]